MTWLAIKYLVTAAVVVAVSEAARRSDRLGALIAALPWVTVLAMAWLRLEGAPDDKIANHAIYTFWYVLPTLPMFLAFPWLLARLGFWPALAAKNAPQPRWFLSTSLRRCDAAGSSGRRAMPARRRRRGCSAWRYAALQGLCASARLVPCPVPAPA